MKWEYQVFKVHENLEHREFGFNTLGDEGWELVSVENDIAYFKRPVEQKHGVLRGMEMRRGA